MRISGSNAGYIKLRGSEGYWLPTPFASFPFTSPPVRHRVPSRFNWTLLYRPRSVAISLLAFILCLFLELRSDGAAEVVTVRNCYMYSICFFDVVGYSNIWSVVMDNSISYVPSIVYFII